MSTLLLLWRRGEAVAAVKKNRAGREEQITLRQVPGWKWGIQDFLHCGHNMKPEDNFFQPNRKLKNLWLERVSTLMRNTMRKKIRDNFYKKGLFTAAIAQTPPPDLGLLSVTEGQPEHKLATCKPYSRLSEGTRSNPWVSARCKNMQKMKINCMETKHHSRHLLHQIRGGTGIIHRIVKNPPSSARKGEKQS